ncbi:hypothetical protein [Natronococcus occultus]|uniref:hypothetical protein n=1 Tax=Natronococcus occultus TaxID=29288 RepID=UPI0006780FD2|nr:hypothetical protein [Natronococcus occultus]
MIETASFGGVVAAGFVLVAVFVYWFLHRTRGSDAASQSTASADTETGGSRLPFLERADDSSSGPIDPQILLPVPNDAETGCRLTAIACALKHRYGDEPLRLLRIEDGTAPDADAFAERLDERETATNTAIRSETIDDEDVTDAIVRAAPEPNTDLVVATWTATDGAASEGVVDGIVSRTPLPIYRFRLARSPDELARLRVVLPRHVDHHEGFYEGIYNVKQLADNLGLPITVYVFEQTVDHYRTLFDLVEIDVLAEFRSVDSWAVLESKLRTDGEPDDLLLALAVREDEIGWDPELPTVGDRFAELPPRSLGLWYLRKDEPAYDERFLRTES